MKTCIDGATLTASIKEAAFDLGFDLIGVARADRVADEDRLARWLSRGYAARWDGWPELREACRSARPGPGCRSIVVVGLVYHRAGEERAAADGHRGRDVCVGRRLSPRAQGQALRAPRSRAGDRPPFDGQVFVDSGPVMEKYWAQQAGLGWRGKDTNPIASAQARSSSWASSRPSELEPDEPGIDLQYLHALHRGVPDGRARRALRPGRAALHLVLDDRASGRSGARAGRSKWESGSSDTTCVRTSVRGTAVLLSPASPGCRRARMPGRRRSASY